jgi:hypothetical protein
MVGQELGHSRSPCRQRCGRRTGRGRKGYERFSRVGAIDPGGNEVGHQRIARSAQSTPQRDIHQDVMLVVDLQRVARARGRYPGVDRDVLRLEFDEWLDSV